MDKPKILTAKELRVIMPRLAGWRLAQNKLSRTFEFQDFVHSLSFVNSLVVYFETMDHHPDVRIAYGEVTFELTRYDLGGRVTDRDVEVAKKNIVRVSVARVTYAHTKRLQAILDTSGPARTATAAQRIGSFATPRHLRCKEVRLDSRLLATFGLLLTLPSTAHAADPFDGSTLTLVSAPPAQGAVLTCGLLIRNAGEATSAVVEFEVAGGAMFVDAPGLEGASLDATRRVVRWEGKVPRGEARAAGCASSPRRTRAAWLRCASSCVRGAATRPT